MREFEALSMKKNETMEMFETRVFNMVSSLTTLGKDLTYKEVNSKVVRALTGKWQTIKENCLFMKDLGAVSPEALFSDFKAMEFDFSGKATREDEDEPSTPAKGLAFEAYEDPVSIVPSAAFSHGDVNDMSKDELREFALTLLKGFNTSNARAAKYKRFYKNQRGQASRSNPCDARKDENSRIITKDKLNV